MSHSPLGTVSFCYDLNRGGKVLKQTQHFNFDSHSKYTEVKVASQMFFADLGCFRFVLRDTSVLGKFSLHYCSLAFYVNHKSAIFIMHL
jgi:hypothetical protein